MSGAELALVLCSALLHAVWSASVKSSDQPLAFNALQAVAAALPAAVVLALFVDLAEVPRTLWWIWIATSISHAVYAAGMGIAFERGELTLTYPLIRATPALLPFVAVPLLGDELSVVGALGIAIVVAGAWAVQVQPGRGWLSWRQPGVPAALVTLLATVGYALFDKAGMRLLAEEGGIGTLGNAATWWCAIVVGHTIPLLPFALWRLPTGTLPRLARREWRTILGAFLMSMVGYGLILQAYQTAAASYVVAVRQTSVLFAIGIAILWLGESPSRRRIAGAVATVVGVACIAIAG